MVQRRQRIDARRPARRPQPPNEEHQHDPVLPGVVLTLDVADPVPQGLFDLIGRVLEQIRS